MEEFVPVVATAVAKLFCTGAICAAAYRELISTNAIQPRALKELSHVNKNSNAKWKPALGEASYNVHEDR